MDDLHGRHREPENSHGTYNRGELERKGTSSLHPAGMHEIEYPIGQSMISPLQPDERGFSLLELMASIAVLLVIAGGVFSAMSYYQRYYQRTQLTTDMHDDARSAIDLITQEVGQAGLLPSVASPTTTLNGAVVLSALSQSVVLTSAANVFVGENLLVDVGANQEMVTVTAVSSNTVTGIFLKSHITGAPVNTIGIFPQGVLSSSTANQLRLFGDINADGTLVYVEYNCNNQSPGPGTLTRSITPISAVTKNASSVLIDNVMPNASGTACFQISSFTLSGFTFVNQVGVTLTVQSPSRDPVTKQFLTITKEALNIVPRNVQMGLTMANGGVTDRLQVTPPGIPIYIENRAKRWRVKGWLC